MTRGYVIDDANPPGDWLPEGTNGLKLIEEIYPTETKDETMTKNTEKVDVCERHGNPHPCKRCYNEDVRSYWFGPWD